jgi:hypothetical protein
MSGTPAAASILAFAGVAAVLLVLRCATGLLLVLLGIRAVTGAA